MAEGDQVAVKEAVSRGELRNGRVYAQECHVLFTLRGGKNRHVEWVELMERLRTSGMSVAELRRYTVLAQRGAVHLEELRALLQAHRQQLQERMAELRRAERLID